MNANGLLEARRRLGLSANEMAAEIGVSPRTYRKWAEGDQDVPRPVQRLVAFMQANHRDDWPKWKDIESDD